MTKKMRSYLNLLLTVFFAAVIIVDGPNMSPLYMEGAFFWCVILSCYAGLNFIFALGGVRIRRDDLFRVHLEMGDDLKVFKKGFIILAVIWIVYFAVSILSAPLFNSRAYRDQLGQPEIAEFNDTIQPLAVSQLPIIDKELARTLADKKVGENPGLGSQVVLGEPVIQTVNEKLVWAVPLQHSGFFKWLKNLNGSAGYIVVSATDLNSVELVTDYKIKYQENAYIFDDLNRYVRFAGGALFNGLTDYSFELDDAGVPYWVLTTYKNKWMFSLPEADGIILVNASTGETVKYGMDNIPEWVDRVQPEEFVMRQIDNQGEYVHGILNFSNQDKFRSSGGHIIVYNGTNCYLFTGLTSVGSDESAIGFVMVDMVTKEYKMYRMNGATEIAAMQSAQGKVQQYGYQASFPMIINMDGRATYFMTLKDNAGLIKQYAFVSVANYTSVGTGETVNAALSNFRQVMNSGRNDSIITGDVSDKIEGTVLRISGENQGDSVIYKLIIKEKQNLIFNISYDLSNELALTQPDDKVAIEYSQSSGGICQAFSFDNLEFEQKD